MAYSPTNDRRLHRKCGRTDLSAARQLHSIVGGVRIVPEELLLHRAEPQDASPPSRAGIAQAGSIGNQRSLLHSHLSHHDRMEHPGHWREPKSLLAAYLRKGSLPDRDFNQRVASGCRLINRRNNLSNLRCTMRHLLRLRPRSRFFAASDSAEGKIVVGGHQHIKPASSAAWRQAPFDWVSHPSCLVVMMVCSGRKSAIAVA
jgi:hypothetical protein